MSTWTSAELEAVAAAIELRVSTRRPDGTFRPAVPIWVVRAGDGICIRREPSPPRSPCIDPMTAGPAAATTLQLTPQR
jgi:hypothetical protein